MARPSNTQIEHLLRRAGFGARPDELTRYGSMGIPQAIDTLLDPGAGPDPVDDNISKPGFAGVTARGPFSPNAVITDARQRWLFRMLHTDRPLHEKMALFWHNHFATGYNKIAGAIGAAEAARYMAGKASEDPAGVRGQIDLFREEGLGNFRDLLLHVAKDVAMLVWLDGRTNTKTRPQENFAREVMELFTMGVGHYTEPDVYAGARVFTGWNLASIGGAAPHLAFVFNAGQHDTGAKTFSFPIYEDGTRTIPARAASDGLQDGVDFINALAASPNTARYLATKLYRFFVNDVSSPDPAFVNAIAFAYLQHRFDIAAVMREVLLSRQFWDPANVFARYAWPVEFVVRAMKDIGWTGFSVNDAVVPLANMGQTLFEPPDVAGWDAGQTWFVTGAMLARMNFAATLASNQQFNLARAAKEAATSPESLLAFVLDQLKTVPLDSAVQSELASYVGATGAWTGSDSQVRMKTAGLVHLVAGLAEYQFA